MNSLTRLELKKVIGCRTSQIACLLIILYIFIAIIGSVKSYSYYTYNEENASIDFMQGLDAIKSKRGDIQSISSYLDEEHLIEIFNYYMSLKGDKKNVDPDGELKGNIWIDKWLPYRGIQNLFGIAFSDINTNNVEIIDTLSSDDISTIYDARINKINEYLDSYYRYSKFSNSDAKAILELAKSTRTPIYYTYYDGWMKLLDNFFFLNVIIILVLCFCVATLFTLDNQNGMIKIILPTENGKSKLPISKIMASIIFSTITYFVFNLLFMVLLLSFYSYSGWNCQIQAASSCWLSIYNINFMQAYLLALFIGFSTCILLILITLLIANLVKKAFLTISTVAVLFLAPIFINTETLSRIPTNIIEALPIKAMNFSYILRQHSMYTLFGFKLLKGYAIPVIFILVSIILIPIIIRLYRKQEI